MSVCGTFVFKWRFTVHKLLAVGVLRKKVKNESGLRSRKNKLWQFKECVTPYNRPSFMSIFFCSNDCFMRELEFTKYTFDVTTKI